MLVYGEGRRVETTSALIGRIEEGIARARRAAGIAAHAQWVSALIEAGCLAQGVADRGFEARGGIDDLDPLADACLAVVRLLAEQVARSWDAGFDAPALSAHEVARALAGLSGLPTEVTTREPEGFSHYAVYPEAFAAAARLLPPGPVCLVGIRSIGTTLAAMAAAGHGTPSGLITVRPVGHPFRRELAISARLRDWLASRASGRFAVVDEGPGLSGSSIAAVVAQLREIGVPPERIHILPSHAGRPGSEADESIRAIWDTTATHAVTFDDLVLDSHRLAHRLEHWCRDLVGQVVERPVEITSGGWRSLSGLPERDWPPAHPWQERRKLLLRTASGDWVARFAGLGRAGEEKLGLARRLAGAGFVPEPAGLRHGFLVEPWLGRARPVDWNRDRAGRVARLGQYLGFRSGLPPPAGRTGATTQELFDMLRSNAAEALGPAAEGRLDRWRPRLADLEERRRPVATDNRLHAWEWLEVDGSVLKADAVDHALAHDLVGPQDIAWDIAGAGIELDLSPAETARLCGLVDAAGHVSVDAELLRFMRPAYAAFQLGAFAMAAAGAEGPDRDRLLAAGARYRTALAACLDIGEDLPARSPT